MSHFIPYKEDRPYKEDLYPEVQILQNPTVRVDIVVSLGREILFELQTTGVSPEKAKKYGITPAVVKKLCYFAAEDGWDESGEEKKYIEMLWNNVAPNQKIEEFTDDQPLSEKEKIVYLILAIKLAGKDKKISRKERISIKNQAKDLFHSAELEMVIDELMDSVEDAYILAETVAKQKKSIEDSIKMANHILSALLPEEEEMVRLLGDHFVLNKPRDVVGGDFSWLQELGDEVLFAVADSTGHGVPGAFMSILGISLLEEIVNQGNVAEQILEYIPKIIKKYGDTEDGQARIKTLKTAAKIIDQVNQEHKEELSPSNILDQLRQRVIQKLKGKINAGMDMVLIKMKKDKSYLEFSTANNPLRLIRGKELIEYKPTKAPIGEYVVDISFETQRIDLQKGDRVFMFSDGFGDQFSENKKKMNRKQMRNALLMTSHLSISAQKAALQQFFHQRKGDHAQIDDVLMVGIEV